MKKFQKKYILSKVMDILRSNKYILIGAYESNRLHNLYRELQSMDPFCTIYTPRNKISKCSFRQFDKIPTAFQELENHPLSKTTSLLEGSIFLLATNDKTKFIHNFDKLIEASIPIYAAIIEESSIKQIYNLVAIKDIVRLLNQTNIYETSYKNLKYQTTFYGLNQSILYSSFFKLKGLSSTTATTKL